jgi:hypothetical protein
MRDSVSIAKSGDADAQAAPTFGLRQRSGRADAKSQAV